MKGRINALNNSNVKKVLSDYFKNYLKESVRHARSQTSLLQVSIPNMNLLTEEEKKKIDKNKKILFAKTLDQQIDSKNKQFQKSNKNEETKHEVIFPDIKSKTATEEILENKEKCKKYREELDKQVYLIKDQRNSSNENERIKC